MVILGMELETHGLYTGPDIDSESAVSGVDSESAKKRGGPERPSLFSDIDSESANDLSIKKPP
jgi:hypothetical protein